jgi:drug/metabolite transporter (DMT)-like permease
LNKRLSSDLTLLLVAFIWGTAFVVQRIAVAGLGTFLFNGLRFLLGALVLLPFINYRSKVTRRQLGWILTAGIILVIASSLQQAGLRYTTAANAGFITGFYVVLIPIIQALFLKRRPPLYVWLCAVGAFLGIYLLSTGASLTFNKGDILELIGAVFWALHVLVISGAVRETPIPLFSAGQYAICGAASLLLGLVLEGSLTANIPSLGWTVLYAGILSVGVAYTLQATAQKHAPPADAAIILSMEAVFAALFGYLFIGEQFLPVQLLGCAFILVSMIAVQIISLRVGEGSKDPDY